MQVGTTKDQGLYNKPSVAVHRGALAAGTLPQYNTDDKKLMYSGINLHSATAPAIGTLYVIKHM